MTWHCLYVSAWDVVKLHKHLYTLYSQNSLNIICHYAITVKDVYELKFSVVSDKGQAWSTGVLKGTEKEQKLL